MKHRKQQIKISQHFSLIELLVAMSVLSILILVLFKFLISAQKVWSYTEANTKIFETAKTTMDIIDRDFRTCMTSPIEGKMIGFYVGNPDSSQADYTDCLYVTFVSVTEGDTGSFSRLCEISYQFHKDDDPLATTEPYTITRKMVSDLDSADWDFCGDTSLPASWYDNNSALGTSTWEKLAGGVEEFSMECYDQSGVLIPLGTEITTNPSKVAIKITLYDEKLQDAPDEVKLKTMRTFTKYLELGDVGSH
ncbi:MAG: hypothetical protein U9O87_08695 [Verrucomicrobiota bacterium]|nr:hypothetical protein [Verrucomicrobiota bacterium]